MSHARKRDLIERELARSLALNRGLFEDFNTGWKDERGRTLLHHAILRNDVKLVEDMLVAGCNVHTKDRIGSTPLHFAVLVSNAEAIIDLLLSEGALPDVPKADGLTPLHEACWAGNADAVRKLLALNASLDQLDGYGRTPEDVAQQYDHDELVAMLQADRKRRVDEDMVGVKYRVSLEWEGVIKAKVRSPVTGLPGDGPRHPRDEPPAVAPAPSLEVGAPHSPLPGEERVVSNRRPAAPGRGRIRGHHRK